MVEFAKRYFGEKFDPNYILPYNVTFENKDSNTILRIVSDPDLPDSDSDHRETINLYFPEQFMLAENRDFDTRAYHESIELLEDHHKQWQLDKWSKNFSLDAVIGIFQNFNRLYAGRELSSAMVTIGCSIWYILDDFFEESLASVCKNEDCSVSLNLMNDYITNLHELYQNYHLEPKPRKWLVFPKADDEKLWQFVWDSHNDYLERNWNTFNRKIKTTCPVWYDMFREAYLRYFPGWRRELEFIIRLNSHSNGDFPDRFWSELRPLCQACYPMTMNLLPWDWKHGSVDLTHWSCLEIDFWAALQNDILSFPKEKQTQSRENIILRELKRLGPDATDSQALLYGVKRAKHSMLEVLNHYSDSHMNERERAFISEYIHFLAAAMFHFFAAGRYGWKMIKE